MSTEAAFSPLRFPTLGGTPGLVEEQARARGHASGYAAGMRAAEQTLRAERAAAEAEHARMLEQGRERIEALATLLASAVDAVGERVAPVLDAAQCEIAAASVDLAEAIIGVELADGPTSARGVVARALAPVDPALVLTVRMHPDTLAALDDTAMVAGLDYRADASLAPGDAIVDFADGYLDARIASAVGRAKQALLGGGGA